MAKLINPKISIIVPAFNAAGSLARTIDCLVEQTYQNLEIIIVDDGSTDNTESVAESYAAIHNSIKITRHQQNAGLFKARLTGADLSTGDYIAFLDADDTVSIDYYRTMIMVAMFNNSDMVLAETIIEEEESGYKYIHVVANDFPFNHLTHENAFKEYMSQGGTNFYWHTAWNKLVRRDLWERARPYYSTLSSHLVMCEDVAISTPLWYFTQRVDRSTTSHHFYLKGRNEASTSQQGLTVSRLQKTVQDLETAFKFFEHFLISVPGGEKYTPAAATWRGLYAQMWNHQLAKSSLAEEDKSKIHRSLRKIGAEQDSTYPELYTYDITAPWNNKLENIKRNITSSNITVVSFDIFDTLITRPFETPSDLFKLIDEEFAALYPKFTLTSFHDIRTNSENLTRQTMSHKEDISIDDIYTTMGVTYNITDKDLKTLKQLEIALEIQFTDARKTARELYQLAKYLGKKVILTTDMYLSTQTINAILTKAGYSDWDELYISSELNKSKNHGSIYEYICSDGSVEPDSILHIGDNHRSDVVVAKRYNIIALHFPKTTEAMRTSSTIYNIYENEKIVNRWPGHSYFGLSCLIAMTANALYDNPFVNTVPKTMFNGKPSAMGYAALGAHLYGLGSWLTNEAIENKYDNFIFLARDGYLPLEAFSLLSKNSRRPLQTKVHYLPSSRKANLALSIINECDLVHIDKFVKLKHYSIGQILDLLYPILKKNAKATLKSMGYDERNIIADTESFVNFTTTLKSLLSLKKITSLQNAFKKSFSTEFSGKVAVFDVGYSAKPEQIYSKLFDKPIDTYFVFSNGEGSYRTAPGTNQLINLHCYYDHYPQLNPVIRELSLSKIEPSTLSYAISANGILEVIPDKDFDINYYERYVIKQLQSNSMQFVRDIIERFGEYRHKLNYTEKHISLLYESITSPSAGEDIRILTPIRHEDSINTKDARQIKDYLNIKKAQPAVPIDIKRVIQGRSRATRILAYTLLDRKVLAHKIHQKTKSNKHIYSILKATYRAHRGVKRRLKRPS